MPADELERCFDNTQSTQGYEACTRRGGAVCVMLSLALLVRWIVQSDLLYGQAFYFFYNQINQKNTTTQTVQIALHTHKMLPGQKTKRR